MITGVAPDSVVLQETICEGDSLQVGDTFFHTSGQHIIPLINN
jgi:hypothetical protein